MVLTIKTNGAFFMREATEERIIVTKKMIKIR